MATRYNYTGGIVTNGLVLNLDAAKVDSYPGTGTTWYDISGNNNNGTLTNGPTFSGIGKQASIVFDGVDDKVTTSTSLYLTDVTLNTWFYFNTQSNQICAQSWNYNTTGGFTVEIYDSNLIFAVNGSGTNNWPRYSINNVATGSFLNITGTLLGNTQTLYVNGAPAATVTDAARNNAKSNQPITIGARSLNGPSTSFSNGKNSITQVYNRSITQFEVFQNFNAMKGRYGIPDIVTNGLVLNLDAGNPYSYLSGSSGTAWSNTVAVSSSISGTLVNGPVYSNGAITFDGTNDYVSIPAHPTSSGLTLSFWAYIPSTLGTLPTLIGDGSQSNTVGYIWIYRSDINQVTWQFATDTVRNLINVTNMFSGSLNSWANYVFVADYTNYPTGSLTVYKNGVLSTTTTFPNIQIPLSRTRFIGSYDGGLFHLSGSISSYLEYDKALTQTEITQNFNALRGRYGI